MEQFETLLSPAAKAVATPDQQQAHAAWEELQATLRWEGDPGWQALLPQPLCCCCCCCCKARWPPVLAVVRFTRVPACWPRPACCRNKRRVSGLSEPPPANLPVTRSGNVRRSAEGLVNQQLQQQRPGNRAKQQQQASGSLVAPAAAAALASVSGGEKENAEMEWEEGRRRSAAAAGGGGGSRRSSGGAFSLGSAGVGGSGGRRGRASLEPAGAALCIVRGRTCTVLDGCLQDDPAQCITLCVRSFTGLEVGCCLGWAWLGWAGLGWAAGG